MAENQDDQSREDLSDEASPYRIEEMRQKGQVAQSRELTGLIAVIMAFVAAYVVIPSGGTQFIEFMKEFMQVDQISRVDLSASGVLKGYFYRGVMAAAVIALPISLAGFFAGILGSFVQIGSIFSTDPLTPDLNKLNPIQGAKRLLSLRQLVEAFRLLFKAGVLVLVAYFLVKAEVFRTVGHMDQDPSAMLHSIGRSSVMIFFSLMGILFVFAGFDFAMQRREYGKKTRLTKQEAKQEHKEREGDPQIKARIRSIQREVARRRMMAAVKKADVIITNPTHIAVAIAYDREKMAAPRVIAKGADYIAQQIKKIAAEAGVPLVENVPLARALHKAVKINHSIPRNLYQAVAEVLAYVYRLRGVKHE